MKVIYNSIIPFKGFVAINLFGVIFVRKEFKVNEGLTFMTDMLLHEACHTRQMKKDGYLHFYFKYLWEYMCGLIKYKDAKAAYRNVSYEIEAYNGKL